jgi:hypothetical protein
MIPVEQLLKEIIISLREVVGPAINEPYPKSQAFMAAVILEFISGQIQQRDDIAAGKRSFLDTLFDDLRTLPATKKLAPPDVVACEETLSRLIEQLYEARSSLSADDFANANRRIRRALREMLDLDLRVAKKE